MDPSGILQRIWNWRTRLAAKEVDGVECGRSRTKVCGLVAEGVLLRCDRDGGQTGKGREALLPT